MKPTKADIEKAKEIIIPLTGILRELPISVLLDDIAQALSDTRQEALHSKEVEGLLFACQKSWNYFHAIKVQRHITETQTAYFKTLDQAIAAFEKKK